MPARYSVLSKSTDYNVYLISISFEMHIVFCKTCLYFLFTQVKNPVFTAIECKIK